MDQKCGFDEKEPCTRKCIYFDTCTRNPGKKKSIVRNEEKVYENMVRMVNVAIHEFTRQVGVQPNRLLLGKDVVDSLIGCFGGKKQKTLFGLEVDVVYGKPGLIEVGYITRTR